MKPIAGAAALWICLLFCLAGCRAKEPLYFELSGQRHTPYQVKYQYTEALDKDINAQIDAFYHAINPFDSTSIISKVNRNEDMLVDSVFIRIFNKAMEVSAQTDGALDITCAPLINLWGFGFSRMDSVTPAMLDSIRTFVGYRKVRLDGNRVVKDDPRVLLNCSALGDGSVCDMLASMLESKGVENYMIDFGGEVRAKGLNPKGECWRIGISKPSDDPTGMNQELQQIVKLCKPCGLATSGNYRNFYEKDGKRYAHTIDPVSGYPIQSDILSATIIAPDGMTADAYATAFMVLGSEKARQLKRHIPEIEYFIICADSAGVYRTECSEGFHSNL